MILILKILFTKNCGIFKQGTKALQDAGITYDKIEQAFVGYVYGWFNIKP